MASPMFQGKNYGAQVGNNYGSITAEFRTYNTTDSDRICVQALDCPDTLAVKNSLKQAKDKLLRQSFEWVLQNSEYLSWRDGNDVCLLWIKGGAGKGKTMMSIGLIETLCQEQDADRSAVVTYFFCQNDNNELNTIASVIKGLIFRLIDQRDKAKDCLRRRWDSKNNRFTEDVKSWQALWGVFLEMLDRCDCSKVYILVDALDECQDDERDMDEFLKSIVRNGVDRPSKIKWILTSRPLDTAERHLVAGHERMQVSLELNSEAVSEAVRYYISYRVEELSLLQRYGDQLKQDIEAELTGKAQGTFLWVNLVCKRLEDVCREEVLSTIESMPQGLPAFYDKVFDQLKKGEPNIVRKSVRLLEVMMLVCRPLDLEEVGSVTNLTDEDEFIKVLVHRCASFINLQGNSIHFVHQSTRDYLSGRLAHEHEQFGHNDVVQSCLSYLSKQLKVNIMELPRPDSTRESLKQTKNEKKHTTLASLGYAAIFWVAHLWTAHHWEAGLGIPGSCVARQHVSIVEGPVMAFLHTKMLEWLECLSLLGKITMVNTALFTSKTIAQNHSSMSRIVDDVIRFYVRHTTTITNFPLQIYSSAMVFSPSSSVLRTENVGKIPSWLSRIPTIESNWPSLNQTLKPHRQRVRTIIFSPDDRYWASGSDDGKIQIWDKTTGEMYRELTVESARIKSIAFSPDSKKIVSGTGPRPSNDRTTVWHHIAAEAQRILICHMGPVRPALWPRGKQIVFSSCQKKIQIWDITTGDIQKTLTGHSGSVYSVVYSPDGGQIASGSFDRMIKIWNATTGEVQKTLLGHSRPVRSVAFSPDGKQIASGSSDFTIKIWNTKTGELQKTIPGHAGQVRSVVFSPDGRQIASGSRDRKVKLWDAVTGELQKTLVDHARSVNTVVFSPDGRYIASGSSDTVVNLWDTKTGGIKKVLATRASPKKDFHMMWSEEVHTLAFSPNGKSIVSGSDDSSIKVWDISMEDDQDIPESHLSWVMFVRFSPNGKQIVSGSIDGLNYLKFWDATTGDLQRTLKSEEIFLKAPPYAILAFLRAIPSFSFKISRLKTRHGFRVTNQWIFYEEYPVLYLPPDFRPTCFDVLGDQIAVGFLSGRVLTFAIDRSRVPSILKEI